MEINYTLTLDLKPIKELLDSPGSLVCRVEKFTTNISEIILADLGSIEDLKKSKSRIFSKYPSKCLVIDDNNKVFAIVDWYRSEGPISEVDQVEFKLVQDFKFKSCKEEDSDYTCLVIWEDFENITKMKLV